LGHCVAVIEVHLLVCPSFQLFTFVNPSWFSVGFPNLFYLPLSPFLTLWGNVDKDSFSHNITILAVVRGEQTEKDLLLRAGSDPPPKLVFFLYYPPPHFIESTLSSLCHSALMIPFRVSLFLAFPLIFIRAVHLVFFHTPRLSARRNLRWIGAFFSVFPFLLVVVLHQKQPFCRLRCPIEW